MVHTLLLLFFFFRCVAGVTQRLFQRGNGSLRAAISPAILTLVTAAGCFTDPINRPPVISELSQIGEAPRGQKATFIARGSDPDQDPITWTWARTADRCLDSKVPANWPHDPTAGEADAPATYVVDDAALTSARYCVWAFATDRYGAVTADDLIVDPVNHRPMANIRVLVDPQQPHPPPAPNYPAYSTFQLSAETRDADNDPLTYTWALSQMPLGSTAALAPCDGHDAEDQLRCFTADLPGIYEVSLVVDDGMDMVTATPVTLMVLPDAPPCIDMTTPLFAANNNKAVTSQGSASDLIVVSSVYDDGDPFINSGGHPPDFFWYKGKNDGKLSYFDNNDYQQLMLSPDDYKIGDVVNVRLEVKDRNPDVVDKILASCRDDADFCSTPTLPPGRLNCYVRVSWRIQLTLPDRPMQSKSSKPSTPASQ